MCSSRFRFRLTFGFLCNLTSVPMAMALFILIFHHEMVPKASCDTLVQGAAMLVHYNDTHCTCDTVLRESSPRASKIAPSCVACASDSHKQSFNISCAATPSPLLHMQKKNCQITTDPETRADKRVQAKQSALRRPPPLGFKWGGRSGMLMGHWTRTEAVRLCADTIHCCSIEIVYHLRQNQSE